jgi:hypothetical protein
LRRSGDDRSGGWDEKTSVRWLAGRDWLYDHAPGGISDSRALGKSRCSDIRIPNRRDLEIRDCLEGAFKSSGPDFLELVTPTGSDLRTAKRNVLKIVAKEKYQDGHRDGLLAGLLLGLGGGIAAGAYIYYTASGEAPESPAGVMAGSGMFGAGIGALTGYLADRSHKGTEVLYQAPRPNP